MEPKTKIRLFIACLILSIALNFGVLGCSHAPDRFNPDYARFRQTMHRFLLVPPEIGFYQEMPDGRMLWQAEGSRDAGVYIEQAVQDTL